MKKNIKLVIYLLSLNFLILTANSITCGASNYQNCKYITIQSVNHSGGTNGRYFNYFNSHMNNVFGGSSWVGKTINVYVQRLNKTVKCIFWSGRNGGSKRDGHGRPNGDSTYGYGRNGLFRTGDKFYFSIQKDCVGKNRVQSNNCKCQSGYYDTSSTSDCFKCLNICSQCTSITQCSACNGANRATPTCNCVQGFYDDQNSVCQNCHSKCIDCSGTSENCTTCKGQNRDLPDCNCSDRFYLKHDICEPCFSLCQTCEMEGETKCLTCIDGYFKSGDQCIYCNHNLCATCIDEADNCIATCNSDCKTCLPSQMCDSCEDNQFLKNGQCLYCDNQVCATCHTTSTTCNLQCGQTCLTCDSSQNCLTCSDGKFLLDSDKTCQNCDTTICGTCINSESECIIQCHDSCVTCNTEGHCVTCQDGYYLNGNICSQCDNTVCGTCVVSPDNCIVSCDSSCVTCNLDGTCLSCISSQFVDKNQGYLCKDCNYKCQQCDDLSDSCTLCNDQFRSLDSNCLCNDKYYDQNNQNPICLECDKQCSTCVDQPNNCLSCIDSNFRSSFPECKCIQKYYQDILTGECKHCKGDCDCYNTGVCYECLGKTTDLRTLPSCFCKNEYYEDAQGKCQKCSYRCLTCVGSADNCLICEKGINRSIQAPQCSCYDGFYNNGDQLKCEQCYFGCITCSSFDVCTGDRCKIPEFQLPDCKQQTNIVSFSVIIQDGQQLQEGQQTQNQSQDGSSLQEVTFGNCDYKCQSCEVSPQNCTSCKIGMNRSQNVPECGCLDGFYEQTRVNSVDCLKCTTNCLTCINYALCSSCDEKQNRQLHKQSYQCICKTGYILENLKNENSLCVPCYNYRGNCYKQCPSNTIQDNKQKSCYDFQQNYISMRIILISSLVFSLFVFFMKYIIIRILSQKKFRQLFRFQDQYLQKIKDKENSYNSEAIQCDKTTQNLKDSYQTISEHNL